MVSVSVPLVSLVTPVFNGADYLGDLIESVNGQDYPNIEHLIIDDGSTDGEKTINILKKNSHLRWWTRPNYGQYATMNEGLATASGEIICFISADDILTPGAVTTAVSYLLAHQNCGGVYGNYSFINSHGLGLKLFQPMRFMPTHFYPFSLHISHSSFYLRKSGLVQNNLFFKDTLRFVGDYEWIVRIIRSNLKIGRIGMVLSKVRIHSQQTTKVSFSAMRNETFEVQKRLGVSFLAASFFRKILFFINLFNSLPLYGYKSTLGIIINRVKVTIFPAEMGNRKGK